MRKGKDKRWAIMWWVWVIVGVAAIAVLSVFLLVGYAALKTGGESNCDRLRRMGERGAYKG